MPYDPLDYLNRLTRNPYAGLLPAEKKEPSITSMPLPEEEADSLLRRFANKGAGGLAWAGEALGKGGRAVRGTISGLTGGDWGGGLLNLLPFSDTVGLTDPSASVTGRQLLERAGMVSPNEEGFDWGDVAGFGVDVLSDPLTYMGLPGSTSALTGAGKAAAKIGALPKTLRQRIQGVSALTPEAQQAATEVGINAADLLNKPLSGVVNVGLPFTEGTVLGAGPGGEKFLDAMNYLGSWATAGKYNPLEPVLKGAAQYGRALFTPEARGLWTKTAQEVARERYAAEELAKVGAEKFFADKFFELKKAGVTDDLFRDVMEGVVPSVGGTPQAQAARQIGDEMVAFTENLRQQGILQGHDAPVLNAVNWKTGSNIGYFPRHSVEPTPATLKEAWQEATKGSGPVHNLHPSVLSGREPWTKGLDWRTTDQLLRDADLTRPLGQGDLAAMGQRLQGGLPAQLPTDPLVADQFIRLNLLKQQLPYASGDELQSILQGLATKKTLAPTESLWLNPLEAWRQTALGLTSRGGASEAVHELLGRGVAQVGTQGTERYLPLTEKLFRDVGFGEQNWQNAAQAVLSRAGQQNVPLDQLANWAVDPALYQDAIRRLQGFTTPSVLKPLAAVTDWATNLFKSSVTSPWPGFHVRNRLSGMLMNLAPGLSSRRAMGMADDLVHGRMVSGYDDMPYFAGKGFTPEQATEELQKLIYAHGARQNAAHDLTGAAQSSQALDDLFVGSKPFPGYLPEFWAGFRDMATGPTGSATPWATRGVGPYRESLFAPVRHGENIGQAVEDLNRIPAMLEALFQGHAPGPAAALSKAAHGNYQALSPFESAVMRRLVPFYTFQRRVGENVVGELLTNPGGLYGQSARAAASLRSDPSQFIPEHLGGGLAVPLGPEQDGRQRFLTKLDINPAEAIFEPLKPTLDRTAMGLLGMTNPLLKGPLEFATGKQFYSGRDLADLYHFLPTSWMEQAALNSPVARLVTSGRQLLDPRKYETAFSLPINLGTGAKISDIDMEKSRDIAARQALVEASRGRQNIDIMEKPYAIKAKLPNLTPEEVLLLRLGASLEKKAKERKKAEEAKK